jgi:hypothetical protein
MVVLWTGGGRFTLDLGLPAHAARVRAKMRNEIEYFRVIPFMGVTAGQRLSLPGMLENSSPEKASA